MKAILCDICDAVMEGNRNKIKYKVSTYQEYYALDGGFCWFWDKIDVCPECFRKMMEYVRSETE